MPSRILIIALALTLPACAPHQRCALYPARLGVSVGINQAFAGGQGTSVGIALIPQWDLRPTPTRPQGPYSVPVALPVAP